MVCTARHPSDPSSPCRLTRPVRNRPSKSSRGRVNEVAWIWWWSSLKLRANRKHAAKTRWNHYTSFAYNGARNLPIAGPVGESDEKHGREAIQRVSSSSPWNLVRGVVDATKLATAIPRSMPRQSSLSTSPENGDGASPVSAMRKSVMSVMTARVFGRTRTTRTITRCCRMPPRTLPRRR